MAAMALLDSFLARLPEGSRDRAMLWLFGLVKVPMIRWTGARIVEASDDRCVVRIPLRRRTKNHLSCMYFGALCVGADVAGGFLAARRVQRSGEPVAFLFKDFSVEFHKRAEGDTVFVCEDGPAIDALVREAVETGERVNRSVTVVATTPDLLGDEPVATFRLTLTLKRKSPRG